MPTLSATGKDVVVNLTVAGVRVDECAATDFTETAQYDDIVTKPLGKSTTEIDRSFTGWSGTITFVERDARLQALIDAYNFALANRLPAFLSITRTINYRNQTSITHTYVKVRIEFEMRAVRGETNTITVNWTTGEDRIGPALTGPLV